MEIAISPLHAALEKIGRERHAKRLNRAANHPDVRPHIGPGNDDLDFTSVIGDARNVLLMGRHGGFVFHQVSLGIYEAHVAVLPEGRGEWAKSMAQACFHWLFTRTEALEIIAGVPAGNVRATAMARALGFTEAFKTPRPSTVYRLTIQDWLDKAPGLEERGAWVTERLGWAGLALVPGADPSARRYMGACFEMFLNAQPHKGVIFHQRWARQCGYDGAEVVSENPVAVVFRGGTVVMQGPEDFCVVGAGGTGSLNEVI